VTTPFYLHRDCIILSSPMYFIFMFFVLRTISPPLRSAATARTATANMALASKSQKSRSLFAQQTRTQRTATGTDDAPSLRFRPTLLYLVVFVVFAHLTRINIIIIFIELYCYTAPQRLVVC